MVIFNCTGGCNCRRCDRNILHKVDYGYKLNYRLNEKKNYNWIDVNGNSDMSSRDYIYFMERQGVLYGVCELEDE